MMAYRVPREPSTPRIAVWRRLKRLGVAQIGDGLVGLPYDAATKESLEWVANMVEEAGGRASMWVTEPSMRRYGRELVEELASDRAAEYRDLIARADDLATGDMSPRTWRSLRSELRRIERRDYFPPPERAEAREALQRLDAATKRIETRSQS